jgi:hypothetical protein
MLSKSTSEVKRIIRSQSNSHSGSLEHAERRIFYLKGSNTLHFILKRFKKKGRTAPLFLVGAIQGVLPMKNKALKIPLLFCNFC